MIDRLFAFDTVEDIFAALEADGSEWALKQLETLRTKSPQSLKVSLRQIRIAVEQRNDAAVQYHFGDREGILRALSERHLPRLRR